MDPDFNKVLNGLSVAILDFDLSSFTSNDTVPPKAPHVLASVLFSKTVKDVDVKFDIATR